VQKAYGVAIVGLGIMGMRMVERIAAHPGFHVASLFDPDPAALARAKAAVPNAVVCDSAAAAMDRKEVRCVYVATPPASHAAHGIAALDLGRALFCEKPLAADLAEGAALARRGAAPGARSAVNFSLAASPAFRALEEEIRHGAIGTPRALDLVVRFAAWPRAWQRAAASWLDGRTEGGFVREVVSHFLFAALRVGGPIAVAESRVDYPWGGTSERRVAARLTAGTLPFALDGAVDGPDDDRNLFTVEGTLGAVRLRDWAQADRKVAGGWETLALGSIEEVRWRGAQAQLDELHAMVEGRPHRLATLAEAHAVQVAAEAILAGG
jgi:predicted dehydrogenase